MKKFLALYYAPKAAVEQMMKATPEQAKAGMDEWMNWAKKIEASRIDPGSPLGKTKKISAEGISDTRNEIGGYSIVQAESLDDAAKLFENHPHFKMLLGGWVEVIEFLPMPSM